MVKKNRRLDRTIIDILLELAGLALLTVLLWNIHMSAAIKQQESNSQTKLNIAQQRLALNAEEAADNLQSYDAFSQAKVDTVAYLLGRSPQIALADACRQWGLPVFYRLDAQGRVVESSVPAAQRDLSSFQEAMATLAPVSLTDGFRYYLSATPDGGVLIAGRDNSEEQAKLTELRGAAYALSTLRVGSTGYVFAVNESDGTVAYHPETALIGRVAAEVGLDPAAYAKGTDGWVSLRGSRSYCMSRSVDGLLLAAVVPENELMDSVRRSTLLSSAVFAIVMTLLVIYALILRREQGRHPSRAEDYRRVGRLYFNRPVASKLRNVAVLGLLAVFLATLYMNTLSVLSRQAQVSEAKLDSVEEILQGSSVKSDALTQEYNTEYAQRARNIAWTLQQDATLVNDEDLAALCDAAQIKSIYVFNKAGRTVATNTNFKDFVLSNDSADQSYPFWQVTKGYIDELVQPVTRDDTALHAYVQYVGVRRLDAEGMVQLGLSPRRIESRLHATTLSYVLRGIAVENNGMILAIQPSDGQILSCPTQKYIGRLSSQFGLTAAALADQYTGMQHIDGASYFVSTRQWDDDTMLCMAVPLSTLYAQRLPTSLWVTLISLLIILAISFFLLFGEKPSQDVPEDAQPQTDAASRFFRIAQSGGRTRMIESAASRWSDKRQPWAEKTPEQKLITIAGGILSVAVLALVVAVSIFGASPEKGSMLAYILGQRWERGFNLFSVTYAVFAMLEVLVVATIIRRVLTFTTSRFGARSETVGRLLDSFIKYAAIIGGVFYCLSLFGVDSAALIASAGILSLVVGLGAQSLIGDILAGIFIVFEGEFRVGDIVTIGDWRGTVLEIGIRTTKIESMGNDIKIFNNSAISGVVNMTKQYSYAYVDVGVEYGESLEHVESVLQKELPKMKQHLPAIVNGPFYKGVASLGDSSVNIRIVAQCQEKDRVQLVRDMNREMKLIFDKHSINIPFPQVVVNQPAQHEQATRSEKRAAEAFVEQQKELTKDMHIHEEG